MLENPETQPLLVIDDLHASVEGTEILTGVDLTINPGETHAIMGPNGSGKSTLAYVLMGHPGYEITRGTITYKGEDITEAAPEERAQAGMFLGFQYPEEIPGVSVVNFLRTALSNKSDTDYTVLELRLKVADAMTERKRNEVLQMAVLEPDFAVLDETDSGLDIDALKIVAEGVERLRTDERGFLIITHYQRMLDYITPDVVHVFVDGKIVESGDAALADQIEEAGYDSYRPEVPAG